MRTKFLTPDYFNTNQTLDFLRIPLSPLPPPPKSISSSYEFLRCCTNSTAISVDLQLQSLPIDDALTQFYSDVLPHTIDAFYGVSPVDSGDVQIPEKEADLSYEEVSAQLAEGTISQKNDNKAMIIQFETPELTQYLENACMSKKEEVELLSEVQECDEELEILNLGPTDPFDFDVKDHVKSMEDICVQYDIIPKLQIPAEVDLLPKINHHYSTTLPLLEVEEIEPLDFAYFCSESLFTTIGEQNSAYGVDLESSCQDLLLSVEIDILEHISDSHSSKLPLEICFTSLNLTQDVDLIQVVEIPYREKTTGLMDAEPIAFFDTLLFEEFKMLDSDSFDVFEAHAICQNTEETELGNIFPEDMPVKSFDELIVSCELAIVDGTFASLSVPDMVDDEKICSLHIIFDKILTELELVPLSTSDEIYLDWHLLGRDECNGDVSSAIEKVFNDIDYYEVGSDLKSDGGNKILLDFFLSDGPSDGLNPREDKVITPSGVSCTGKHLINEIVSRKSPDEDCQIIENIGNLTNADFASGKLSDDDCQIVENVGICDGDLHKQDIPVDSIPQFNDLDFFLNPTHVTGGMRTGNKVKPLDSNSMLYRGLQKKETAPSGSFQMQGFDVCVGVNTTSNDRDTIKLEALLTSEPVKEKGNKASSEALGGTNACNLPMPLCYMAQDPEPVHPYDPSFQDMPIIINTQNFDKEMIISRRSTYQKILTLEKRGVQVVERDLTLPVDIILNSTMCIVWYDCKNIGKKATTEDEGASSVPLCIENIAANVLTSLSFVFTTCALIFEGDCNFLGPVMESADELYVAAASLGIYLQIFYSSSYELTDEIILNCIRHSRDIYKGLPSGLPDSETLAESFLTKFPSINPLSAHAIVSSGCTLLEFLELTVEGRIHILRKNHVPDESVNLFSALCKYGEREESKSGLTDCSSSVSSPPDSGRFACKISSDDRKRKFNATSCDPMYDFKCSIPSKKYADDGELTDQGMLRSSDSKESKSPRKCLQKKLPDFLLDNELFHRGEASDTAANTDPSKACSGTDIFGGPKIPQINDGFARSTLLVNDGFPSQHRSGRTIKNKREDSARDILQDLQEDFVGEVVDFYDKSLFGRDFEIDEKTVKTSPMGSEVVKDNAPRYNRTARRLSFGNSPDRNFLVTDVMDTSCMLEDNRQLRSGNTFNGVEYNWSNNICKAPERQEQTARNILEKSRQSFGDQFSKGKNEPSYGETPFSKAIHSGNMQQGSPWTIEFLNRIKEKRRLRQQGQPYASVPQTGHHGNITKATKRRSPSILEYYKYQSDNTPRKVAEQKMQKRHPQLRNERSQGFRPICTPIDKRARRSLSFATTGTGSQTKLVWSNNISCSQDNRFSS